MAITFGAGSTIRGLTEYEDFSVTHVDASYGVGVNSSLTQTVADITYNAQTSTGTRVVSNFNITNPLLGLFETNVISETPAVCTVDQFGKVTVPSGVTSGLCTALVSTQVSRRRVSQSISTIGNVTLYNSVASLAVGSLRKYLYDQQVAALVGVSAGTAAQRAHSTAGDLTSPVNTLNFLRAQSQVGFHPFRLDVLDQIMVGGVETIRWRAWITPHHYLTWRGHGAASSTGNWVTIRGETVVQYSATPWAGVLCKLMPATVFGQNTGQLPYSLVTDRSEIGVWSRLLNTYDVGTDSRWVTPTRYGYGLFPVDDPRYPYQKWSPSGQYGPMGNGGDSGSPSWVGIREGVDTHATLVPIGITVAGGSIGGANFSELRTEIQDAVTLLGASGPFTVQTVNLSAFNTY